MPLLNLLASLRRNLFTRPRLERDLDEEVHAYLDQLTDEKRAAGMGTADARRAALIEFGGLEQVKEEVRQARAGHMLEQMLQDLLQHVTGPRLSDFFFDLFQAAELDQSGPARIRRAHAGRALFVGQLVQVGVHFLVEVALEARPREEIAPKPRQQVQQWHGGFLSVRL